MPEVDDMRVPNGKVLEWAKVIAPLLCLVLTAVLVPMVRWTYSAIEVIKEHDAEMAQEIAVIRSNRFTSEDAVKMYEVLAAKADRSDVPPVEVRNDLAEIKQDIREIRRMVQTYHSGGGP